VNKGFTMQATVQLLQANGTLIIMSMGAFVAGLVALLCVARHRNTSEFETMDMVSASDPAGPCGDSPAHLSSGRPSRGCNKHSYHGPSASRCKAVAINNKESKLPKRKQEVRKKNGALQFELEGLTQD